MQSNLKGKSKTHPEMLPQSLALKVVVERFQRGEIVRAAVGKGKETSVHVGRVAIRVTGSFNIQSLGGTIKGIKDKYCRLIQRVQGYNCCNNTPAIPPTAQAVGFLA